MSRTADYTIQGFIYQFNKTLFEILNSEEFDKVDIEGIIEDIDIVSSEGTRAIQCKYHESKEKFQLSTVYKPILQMMDHFFENRSANIKYRLFAYFSDETPGEVLSITVADIRKILKSKDPKYNKLIEKVKNKIIDYSEDDIFEGVQSETQINNFLENFTLEFGSSLEDLTSNVLISLEQNGLNKDDIDTLHYPNAIQKIADMSIKHTLEERRINKNELLTHLRKVKTTAITRWTTSLKTLDKILKEKRKQLEGNLSKNSRLRYFVISEKLINEFENEIVKFISEYLAKYHFKELHDKTPIFCLDCSVEMFNNIRVRLHTKKIVVKDGLITDQTFDKVDFLKEPFRVKGGKKGTAFYREFDIKLIRMQESVFEIFNQNKPDDYYLFTKEDLNFDFQDTNFEKIEISEVKQIKYILGMCNTYE